jgi:hypothetical protein
MAEIKRTPITIVVGDVEYHAFDEYHTIADVARWLHTQGDTEAAIMILQEQLKGSAL